MHSVVLDRGQQAGRGHGRASPMELGRREALFAGREQHISLRGTPTCCTALGLWTDVCHPCLSGHISLCQLGAPLCSRLCM